MHDDVKTNIIRKIICHKNVLTTTGFITNVVRTNVKEKVRSDFRFYYKNVLTTTVFITNVVRTNVKEPSSNLFQVLLSWTVVASS